MLEFLRADSKEYIFLLGYVVRLHRSGELAASILLIEKKSFEIIVEVCQTTCRLIPSDGRLITSIIL